MPCRSSATAAAAQTAATAVAATTAAICLLLLPALSPAAALAQAPPPATLSIAPNTIVTPVSPMLYGMMTEEINHAFDGGLYPELINNRTFRGSWDGVHWDVTRHGSARAGAALDKTSGPSKALPTSVKLTVADASPGNEAGLTNTGYWGIGVKPNTTYKGSFFAKLDDAGITSVTAQIVSDRTGAVLAKADVPVKAGDWTQYQYSFKTANIPAGSANHFQLLVAHPGAIAFQLVSLMPPTYHDRPNGFRPDLMERMAALHPKFLRLPGGNYLEGDTLQDWYNFKETIGPMVDRPGHQAPWTYWSTDAMGLLEFLNWTEDLHIEPVLAVYAGYALKGEHVTPGPNLQPYVQAAIDEVEYVTGDASTKWGAQRAKDGHPAPFPLHFIEIGNEDWFDKSGTYDARFAQFAQALHKTYPQYKLIATTPVKETAPDAQPDVLDDHYYKPSADMLDFVHHYDDAPRTGPKIFVGEWATLSGTPTPNFGGALADAAWMTGMERNSDLIIMASYAPLLINVNPGAGQWYTNMIGFDASTSFASPSYYAQSLFAGHLGDGTAKSTLTGAGERFFVSATVGSADHVLHLKLVNASNVAQPLAIDLQGVSGVKNASMTTLHGDTFEATNTITDPNFIHPIASTVRVSGSPWQHTVPPLTIEVLDIPTR